MSARRLTLKWALSGTSTRFAAANWRVRRKRSLTVANVAFVGWTPFE